MHFLDNLKTITQEGSMETRQMTPFFSSTFSNLFVIFISEFENAQNSFSCGPHFGPFQSVKFLNFLAKSYRFRQLIRLLKIYILSTRRSQIPIFLAPGRSKSLQKCYNCHQRKLRKTVFDLSPQTLLIFHFNCVQLLETKFFFPLTREKQYIILSQYF